MPTIAGGAGPQSIQVVGEDYAKGLKGLSVEQLGKFLQDIDYQPPWRNRADIEADYFDANQYTAADLQAMEAKGIPPIVVNLIAPTINLILGMEAKVRQDLVISPENEENVDFALAMTKELQIAERNTHFDKACSDAYAGQIKTGLHWVHTHRNPDPFGYPYVTEPVHRREIWWDWQDQTPDLRRARWLVRRKWFDLDVLYHRFPNHKRLIDEIAAGWALFESRAWNDQAYPLYQDWLNERDFYADADTWRNLERQQAMLYEVWYRVPKWTYVLTFQNGMKSEFDETNRLHRFALSKGAATVEYASLLKMYLSWWIGPHRLVDMPSPLPHDSFPYVPFWGYREDRTAIPYGHIRNMKPLQDEVNARRARMLWQLSARRLVAWDDAVKDKKQLEHNIARPDAAVYLDSEKRRGNRKISDMLQVDYNLGLNAQQMEAYRDAAERLQDVANVFMEQLGKGANVDSGIAISQLIEQGTTALAELNENYTFARQLSGQQLFAFVKHDIGNAEKRVMTMRGGRRKPVMLNQRKVDENTGLVYRTNDVATTAAQVALDSVPASGTFRQYQFKQLAELVKKLPPELQAPMLDMVVEASDLQSEFKDEIARRIREMLGIEQEINPEEMSPEEQRAYAEKADMEDLLAQMETAMNELAVERADLENRKIDAETEQVEAETDKIRAEVVGERADTAKTSVETARLRREPIRDPNAQRPNGGAA